MIVTAGMDVGSSSVKTAVVVDDKPIALRTDRIRRRELRKVIEESYEAVLADAEPAIGRQAGGLNGFMLRTESEHDSFGAGHAGTAAAPRPTRMRWAARTRPSTTNNECSCDPNGCIRSSIATSSTGSTVSASTRRAACWRIA